MLFPNKRSKCCQAEVTPKHLDENWMKYQLVCNKCLELCDYLLLMDLSDCCNASIKTTEHEQKCMYCNKNCKPVPSYVERKAC